MSLGFVEVKVSSTRNVIIQGKTYRSVNHAAKLLGIPRSTLAGYVADSTKTEYQYVEVGEGLGWEIKVPINEGRERSRQTKEVYRETALRREANLRRKINVDGVIFDNVRAAAKVLRIRLRNVVRLANDPQQTNFFFVDGINPPA